MRNSVQGRHWAIADFHEGPFLRTLGPLWMAEMHLDLVGDCDHAWDRFLAYLGKPNTEASRRKYRKRGCRRVEVRLTLEMVDRVEVIQNE